MKQVAKFVHENAQALAFGHRTSLEHPRVALCTELDHRVGDGIVQTAIECPEANIAVVVNDLVDHQPQLQQPATMGCCADSDLGQAQRVAA